MRSLIALALFLPLAAPAQTPSAKFAQKPYMGWSTWSFLRGKPTEEKVKAQVDALFAAHLPDYGYRYINLDAGWTDGYDDHGVPKPNLTTFPSGMDGFGQYLHSRGLLFGIYLNPGVDQKLYDLNPIIEGTTAHIHDITDTTQPGSTHKGSYRIDFTKPAARAYINSIVQQLARWKVDFVKLDFVGPGGGNLPADNREELRQWHAAIQRSKRPIWLELSNWLSIDQAPLWRATSNGWRIENDIECYPCGRSTDPAIKGNLTIWSKVSERFADVRPWIRYAGPAGNGGEGGWNDFDSLELGNGDKDGITPAERQTMFTLWAISCAPLYLGTDLTHMDPADLTIITNRNLIAINQAGIPARHPEPPQTNPASLDHHQPRRFGHPLPLQPRPRHRHPQVQLARDRRPPRHPLRRPPTQTNRPHHQHRSPHPTRRTRLHPRLPRLPSLPPDPNPLKPVT